MASFDLHNANLKDKKVIIRVDFNVPLDEEGNISDTTRVDQALPTLKLILEKNPKKLVIMSHLGRPKGETNQKYSLEPVAKYLAETLSEDVTLTESCLDSGIKTMLGLSTNKIILLQNLRFHKEEESNDPDFSRSLASYGDIYVNDAFGTAHRKHASTYGIVSHFKNRSYFGLLMDKEIKALSKIIDAPKKPFVAIMGGAKVSDKIKIIERLLPVVDKLLIGGAMAYPFLKSKGEEIGKSLCSDEDVKLAKTLLIDKLSNKIMIPSDHIVAKDPESTASNVTRIPQDQMALDIGPKTREAFENEISKASTILWNGPMGLFEKEAFSEGTLHVAEALSESNAYTLVGGGDSVSALKKSGLSDKVSHVSTGGGASLKFLEEGSLVGISAIKFN